MFVLLPGINISIKTGKVFFKLHKKMFSEIIGNRWKMEGKKNAEAKISNNLVWWITGSRGRKIVTSGESGWEWRDGGKERGEWEPARLLARWVILDWPPGHPRSTCLLNCSTCRNEPSYSTYGVEVQRTTATCVFHMPYGICKPVFDLKYAYVSKSIN